MAALHEATVPHVQEVGDDDDGLAAHAPLDLDAASSQLETMSAELDALLKHLEEGGDVPAEVMDQFKEDELEREGLEAAKSAADPAESVAHLSARVDEVTAALESELVMTKELQAFQKEVEADNAKRADDCQRAMQELVELRRAYDEMTSESAVDVEFNRLMAKRTEDAARATAEAKANVPPPPPSFARAETKDDDDDLANLHPDDLKLADEATPTDEEAQKMIYLLAKMKYQALGVQNAQLQAQIADLEAVRDADPDVQRSAE